MALRHSYTLFAPIYDRVVKGFSEQARQRSLRRLSAHDDSEVLIPGIGSGLDIPHLQNGLRYHGIDITPAMLAQAEQRAQQTQASIELHQGDVMALPFEDGRFDAVVMHLILAVVPQPQRALAEAARVLKPSGQLLILDKFLHPGQLAPIRRLLNLLSRHIATRTDVVFEPLLKSTPSLSLIDDQPAIIGGWFRSIELKKQG